MAENLFPQRKKTTPNQLARLLMERRAGKSLTDFQKKKWSPPDTVEKILTETPFLGPLVFTYRQAGLGGVARFGVIAAIGQIPFAGDAFQAIARAHISGRGVVLEVPPQKYRDFLKAVGAKEGARLLKPLERIPSKSVPETGAQYVLASPDIFRPENLERISKFLTGAKAYYAKSLREKNMPAEFRAAKYSKYLNEKIPEHYFPAEFRAAKYSNEAILKRYKPLRSVKK